VTAPGGLGAALEGRYVVERELGPFLVHPRLGPLVKQLYFYARRPGLPPLPGSP
jgi:hypothetical protein